MVALDTILADVHNGTGAAIGLTAATPATGDSFTVRNFPDSAWGRLEGVYAQASGTRQVRVTSPAFHDNVTGLTFTTSQQPGTFFMPDGIGQPLVHGDTLAVSLDAAATSDSLAALLVYYSQMSGSDGRYYQWGDISGIVKSIKAMQVAVTSSATIGQWVDTGITTTENQMHAGTDYAILGYLTSVALAAVGVKGQETGNLRACGPGSTNALDTSDYFVDLSNRHGTPHIPVLNADNRNSIYVSVAANTASVASTITLICAELSQRLS